VSERAARELYGVIIASGTIDKTATDNQRDALLRSRISA